MEGGVMRIAIARMSGRARAVASRDVCRAPHCPALSSRRSRVADDAGEVSRLDVLLEGVCGHKGQPLRIALLKPGLERVAPVETVLSGTGSEATLLGIPHADYTQPNRTSIHVQHANRRPR